MSRGLLGILPSLSPKAVFKRPLAPSPFPLDEPSLRLFAWGRQGLHAGLGALGIGAGDEVLVPAYHHGSEIEALIRTGARPRFYAGGEDLQPDETELEALLGSAVRALHLTHFAGFPQDGLRWRRWCDERGLLLIEDAAQAWLALHRGQPVGSVGDMAMFCLYKSVPVPDGGALVCRADIEPDRPARAPLGARRSAAKLEGWAGQRSRALARLSSRRKAAARFDAAREFGLGDPGAAASRTTKVLLPRVAGPHVRERRQRNYRGLLAALGEHAPGPFDSLPEGASPFFFPLRSEHKGRVLAEIRASAIDALDFWSVPHPALEADRFPGVAERRATTIGLPVHQELDGDDVDRIAAAALASLRL